MKERPLDILNNDIGKIEIAPRKPWLTEAMVKKMEERIVKTSNIKGYRRLYNQLRRETGRTKEICKEIMGTTTLTESFFWPQPMAPWITRTLLT